MDSGNFISLVLGKSCTVVELTNKKNTKMVKISISDTMFNAAPRLLRL
jgi:hypothetical protein